MNEVTLQKAAIGIAHGGEKASATQVFERRFIDERPPWRTAELGAMAVELLEDMMGGLNSTHDQLKVECTLIERASG